MTNTDPTPDDIDDTIDSIAANTRWSVEDWDFQTGRYDEPRLYIELEWDPLSDVDERELFQIVKNVIDRHGENNPANIDKVVDEVVKINQEIEAKEVYAAIDHLKTVGEVYEPRTDHVRTV